MKIEFNKNVVDRISELEHLWVSLVSWNLIIFEEDENKDEQMREWAYEHYFEDVMPFVNMVDEKYRSIGYPDSYSKYFKHLK